MSATITIVLVSVAFIVSIVYSAYQIGGMGDGKPNNPQ